MTQDRSPSTNSPASATDPSESMIRGPKRCVAVGVGVVTYNNPPAQLERLLRSIDHTAARLDPARDRATVLTIDCGQPAQWAHSKLPFRRLNHRGNLGFGRAMNCLMAEAFADSSTAWFLCVNPDGTLHHALLATMLECARQYPGNLIEARQFPEEHPKPYDLETGKTLWASGACLLIPRPIYETIGGFDPNIFMYMEDVDYSWRARAAGFEVRVAPRALFAHSVLDRKSDPLSEKYDLSSARYLASKRHKFHEQILYEQVIRDRGFAADGDLPPLPAVDPTTAIPPERLSIADFSHGYAFSPLRW